MTEIKLIKAASAVAKEVAGNCLDYGTTSSRVSQSCSAWVQIRTMNSITLLGPRIVHKISHLIILRKLCDLTFHDDDGFGCIEEDKGAVVHQMGLATSSNTFTYIY